MKIGHLILDTRDLQHPQLFTSGRDTRSIGGLLCRSIKPHNTRVSRLSVALRGGRGRPVLQRTRLFLGANDPAIHLAGDEEARQSPSVGNQRKRRGKNQGGDKDEKSDTGPEEGED